MPNSTHFQSEIKQTFAHPKVILSQNTQESEAQHLSEDQQQERSHSLAPTPHTTSHHPPRNNYQKKLTKEMRQALIDRRVNGEEYDTMPFFTSITESVSCSSEEAAHQGLWSAARDTGKRSTGGIFSRRRQQQKIETRDDDDDDDEENEIEFIYSYSQTDEERDSIWATDGRDESVEVFTPFSLPNNMKHFKQSVHHHPKSTDSRSTETTSTWMHETTFGSGSLLDDDDNESLSTAPSPSSSAASSSLGTMKSAFDDEETYNENESSYPDEDYLRFDHPVESFLDEMAENRSLRRIGNFFLSKTCFAEQVWDDDDDHYYDDDEDDDDVVDRDDHSTSRRGRPRSPKTAPPGIKLLFSLASSADSILEARSNGHSLWSGIFHCSTEPKYQAGHHHGDV